MYRNSNEDVMQHEGVLHVVITTLLCGTNNKLPCTSARGLRYF